MQQPQDDAQKDLKFEVDELREITKKAQKILVEKLKKLLHSNKKIGIKRDKFYFEPSNESAMKVAQDLLSKWREGSYMVTSNKIVSGNDDEQGRAIIIIPPNQAKKLAGMLLDKPIDSLKLDNDPLVNSALEESLNIMANSYVTSIADHFKKKIWIGKPNIINSFELDKIISTIASREDEVKIILENELEIGSENLSVYLFILLSPGIFE